ncbi:hypothetical protein MMC19_005034 [Ptychographa xylographoides]|nr:hypothetical protein [Ptychographa xylographoides]
MHTHAEGHHRIPETSTSHPNDSIPEEPTQIPKSPEPQADINPSESSPTTSSSTDDSASDSETPTTPSSDRQFSHIIDPLNLEKQISSSSSNSTDRKRRASTLLISSTPGDVRRILGEKGGTKLVGKVCCGGGCCFLNSADEDLAVDQSISLSVPDSEAFRSLQLKLGRLNLETTLTNTVDIPEQIVSFASVPPDQSTPVSTAAQHPPEFVTPHPPYSVFPAKVHHARELTKPGAEKRTYHFELDVTDYPTESGDVDFVVGGAIGVCIPNSEELVEEIFDALAIPKYLRDKPVLLRTSKGRWPTIWGDEKPRELVTTRRELLTWCSDVQSFPTTKLVLRVLAEYAEAPNEKKILLYLASAQGQAAFCDLRTGPYITLVQLLNAFPSSRPPLNHLLSVLNTLMPRFYSLSQDPQISCDRQGKDCHRLIEIAVTVHEMPNWRGGPRTGAGSGYFERVAKKLIEAEKKGVQPASFDLRVPMFRGLMANPLAREFVADGPMLLIGAGVGVAPFRGFVQRRLKSANCANKVWVLQGVRDSLLDELYSGEWGVEEEKVKTVVQSRRGEGRYVQEEVRHQADLVWFIVNAPDGRVFVCGSTKGMGEGVEKALVDVVMEKGNLNLDEAEAFWKQKKEGGQKRGDRSDGVVSRSGLAVRQLIFGMLQALLDVPFTSFYNDHGLGLTI